MKDILSDVQKLLRAGAYKNEEHVRLALVARIVQALGWNIWNPAEVNTEFIAIPHEDKTRVDMALFLPPYHLPSVFMEIKAVGKMLGNLPDIERQTRDYNRNNTAPISIITDGRYWKFYLSQTGGEFSQKRFLELDILDETKPEDDFANDFLRFLSKDEIHSERAMKHAHEYHQRTRSEKNMIEALVKARKDFETQYITKSLVVLFQERLSEAGIAISYVDAVKFIEGDKIKVTPPLPTTPSEIYVDPLTNSDPTESGAHFTKHTKSPRTRLRVRFSTGKILDGLVAADTFVRTLKELGIERVMELGETVNHIPLVSTKLDTKYSASQKEISPGRFVITHSSTEQKKDLLEKIARKLGVSLSVDIIS